MSVEPPSSGGPTGPPSGPLSESPQPPAGPHRPWWRSVPRVAALSAVLVAAVVVAVVLTRPGGGSSGKGGEVFLQAADKAGPDPFTESTAQNTSAPAATSSPTVSAAPGDGIRPVQGGAPGLYGGTQTGSSCDVEKQIKALQADAAKNRAFASQAGVQPSDVPAYLRSLTPVTLRVDTRVTNHGYRDGAATSFQSVLQAGTAVLIDGHGVPRARCVCGNPLTTPVAQRTTPRTVGDHWASYRPSTTVFVTPSPVIISVFVIYDFDHRDWFHRHRGDYHGRHDQLAKPPKDQHPWNRPILCASAPGTTGTPGSSAMPCPSMPGSPSTSPPTGSSSSSSAPSSSSSSTSSSSAPSSSSSASRSPSSQSPSTETSSAPAPPSSESSTTESPAGPTAPTGSSEPEVTSSAPAPPGSGDSET